MRELRTYLIDSAPYVLSILRIVAGFLFLQHGMQKLFGYPVPPYPSVSCFYTSFSWDLGHLASTLDGI